MHTTETTTTETTTEKLIAWLAGDDVIAREWIARRLADHPADHEVRKAIAEKIRKVIATRESLYGAHEAPSAGGRWEFPVPVARSLELFRILVSIRETLPAALSAAGAPLISLDLAASLRFRPAEIDEEGDDDGEIYCGEALRLEFKIEGFGKTIVLYHMPAV